MNSSLQAKCQVCGDRAISHNFNGLSCESCKIFFRRHANRRDTFECVTGKCVITRSSRTCCRKCRLEQCFRIGMKKELIDCKYTRKPKESEVNLEEYVSNTKENSASLDNICLNPNELEKLQEVQSAMSIFIDESKLPVVRIAYDLVDAMNVHSGYVRKIIKMCKSIAAFRALSPEDQLAVLKDFHCDIQVIRVSFTFNPNKDGFPVIEDGNESAAVFISLELFDRLGSKNELIESYRSFVLTLQAAMENDRVIRDLLIARQLFSITADKIAFPEFIRYQHQMYLHILKLYLNHKYGNEERADTKFAELLDMLSKFDRIKVIKREMVGELNSDELTQEVAELFGLDKS